MSGGSGEVGSGPLPDGTRDRPIREELHRWMVLAGLTLLVSYLYVFLEWLFFVTKESFMSSFGGFDKLRLLLTSPLLLVAATLAGVILSWTFSLLWRRSWYRTAWFCIAIAIPGAILSAAALLLIDNFTYTVFGFGIVSTRGSTRWAYIGIFAALLVAGYAVIFWIERQMRNRPFGTFRRWFLGSCSALAVVSAAFATSTYLGSESGRAVRFDGTNGPNRNTNVLLFSGDGITPLRMSAFGYARDTTPYLRTLISESLVCENAFSNSNGTTTSTASLLSGKLPTETGMLFRSDILRGRDVYDHLPGVLKSAGYTNFFFGVDTWADPMKFGMRSAFDWINGAKIADVERTGPAVRLLGHESAHFLYEIRKRIQDRLLHVFHIREMSNPMDSVRPEGEHAPWKKDGRRIERLISFIDESPGPFFAHVHLMGTHPFTMRPHEIERKFSIGKEGEDNFYDLVYDDAVLNFDGYLREVVEHLKATGRLEETIVVILSDHSYLWSTADRIPLVIRFPSGEHRGRIGVNTQLLDLGPTILEYLGITRPHWMRGASLLSGELEPGRLIWGAGGPEVLKGERDFQVILRIGHHWYDYNMRQAELIHGTVLEHTSPLDEVELPSLDEVERYYREHLAENGFDIPGPDEPLFKRKTKAKDGEIPRPSWETDDDPITDDRPGQELPDSL